MNVFRVPLLSGTPGLSCLFIGRGPDPRPDPARLAPMLWPAGEGPCPVVFLKQVHSARCLTAKDARGGLAGEGDALATDLPGLALGIATADCLPLVVLDPEARALAAVHAGWRGTLAGVLPAAISTICSELGARRERILIEAGPGAGACCYQVGPEVVASFRARRPEHVARILVEKSPGAAHLNLVEANRLQAGDAGVAPARFRSAALCTICRPRDFHSHRRDGPAAGRMWLLAALTKE